MEAQLQSMHLNIRYIRSMEDTPRVRAACVRYLRTWLPEFYPERPDLVAKARELAVSLGGELDEPRLSWKYALIGMLFGRHAAKRMQLYYNECKSAVLRLWDRALCRLDGSKGKRATAPFPNCIGSGGTRSSRCTFE